jgi:hypothetical protein
MLNPTTGNLLHSLRSFRNFRATAESFDLDRGGFGTAHNEAALRQSITRPDQEAAAAVLLSGATSLS